MSALAWTAEQVRRMNPAAWQPASWRQSEASRARFLAAIGREWRSGPEVARLLGVHPTHALRLLREAAAAGAIERREGFKRRLQYRRVGR